MGRLFNAVVYFETDDSTPVVAIYEEITPESELKDKVKEVFDIPINLQPLTPENVPKDVVKINPNFEDGV